MANHHVALLLMLLTGPLLIGAAALYARPRMEKKVLLEQSSSKKKRKKYSCGVDFGGTSIKLALVSTEHGFLIDSIVVNIATTSRAQPNDLIDQIVSNMTKLLLKRNQIELKDLEVIGVSCPGRITDRNIVSTVANLENWHHVALGDLLARRVDHCCPVLVFNDAKSALMAEVWSGSGVGSNNVCLLTLGTGVGAAVYCDGRLLQGHTGMFGEVGHHIMMLGEDARLSTSTGVRGIAEEYCSAHALQLELGSAAGTPPQEILQQAALEEAKNEEEEDSLRAVRTVAKQIAVLVINCCRMYDPEMVLLGGGLSNSKLLVREIDKAVPAYQWTLAPPTFKLKTATHGNWAGAIGCVKLALMEE